MKNLSRFSSILLFITCLSGSLWLGSYLAKLLLLYGLFEDTDFMLKSYLTVDNLSEVLLTFFPVFTSTLILYIIFFISFLLFLIFSKINLRRNGWFFITIVLVFVTFPFEAYLLNIDYKILMLLNSNIFNSEKVLELIRDRFRLLSSFPLIEIFCYFGIIFLIIFKPLTKEEIQIAS